MRIIGSRIASIGGSNLGRRRLFSDGKPPSSGGGNANPTPSSSSLSTYEEQYKALENLDFMKASKILFSEPPKKKKFGWDFHLVQLFFACLPSLAVYLVAQYARSEMRRMDAELEKRKQAEAEKQAKEMERKNAEDEAAIASNPAIVEVKQRLDQLELTLNQIILQNNTKEKKEK
ncbi:hypothetical protein M569_14986 [Genlisea aurea]|uniref:Uncharacterized protein n=1 Tax=Genlisea aurea TaxID=192259 RepID=S8C5X7_9LAMI|nr:hypothetical protein M569_14986 [Genlisea aurea]